MALDLSQVATQLQALVPRLKDASRRRDEALPQVRRALNGEPLPWQALRERVEDRVGLLDFPLPARLVDDPHGTYPLPAVPSDYAILATDGSQIDLDRHASTSCYVINVGEVVLRYGTQPHASLSSHPTLESADRLDLEDEGESDDESRASRERVRVELERAVAEIRALRNVIAHQGLPIPTLALLDGSLILWSARSAGEDGRYYVDEYVAELEALRRLATDGPLMLASYISSPGGSEVVNALRVSFCHPDSAVCRDQCWGRRTAHRRCDLVTGIRDAHLFEFLRAGERSSLFGSRQKVLESYGDSRVSFFYLNAGPEIARVEVPAWVANDPALVDLVHALVYDQCGRGFGYPVALMEAHEQAVVSEADRQEFWQLVRLALAGQALPESGSAKAFSKRAPWA